MILSQSQVPYLEPTCSPKHALPQHARVSGCKETNCHDIDYFLAIVTIFISGGAKKPDENSKEDEQTLVELNSAHRRSQARLTN